MSERLSQSQELTVIRGLRLMEKAWRVFIRPRSFPIDEVENSSRMLVFQKKNLEVSIQLGVGGIDPEIYDKLFMGIYHHGIEIPPELKFKDPRRN